MKTKGMQLFLVSLLTVFLFSGCKFEKEPDIGGIGFSDEISINPTITGVPIGTEEPDIIAAPEVTENPVTIVVDYGHEMDADALIDYFYGETKEILSEDGYMTMVESIDKEDGSSYTVTSPWKEDVGDAQIIRHMIEKDGRYLEYALAQKSEDIHFEFGDLNENAAMRYRAVAFQNLSFSGVLPKRILDIYPEEDLEGCTRREAIEACAPIAKACGYGNAQVNAYAMTKEVLNNLYEESHGFYSAPNPKFDYAFYEKNVDELTEKIEDAEQQGNNTLVRELSAQLGLFIANYGNDDVAWSDETEAYLIVYQSILNGRLLDDGSMCMYCIYVPRYQKVVHARGVCPYIVTETLEESKLLTKEEAMEKLLQILNRDTGDGINITKMSMVYQRRYDKIQNVEKKTIDPYWRIEYELDEELKKYHEFENDCGTIIISAIDGKGK